MPFDQTPITEVKPPIFQAGQLWISWTSTAPAGSWYQVYISGRLMWFGQSLDVSLPAPSGRVRINVGVVGSSERSTDFSSTLGAVPPNRANLAWKGGTYQDDTIQAFNIYSSTVAGGAVSYTTPLATIAAYEAGIITDGWGYGGWGDGGWGRANNDYTWQSLPLTNGTWTFGIKPIDAAGNEGTATTATVTIAVPPLPPARFSDGKRLHTSYSAGTRKVTLTWNASPG
jgi:hypothetical protein